MSQVPNNVVELFRKSKGFMSERKATSGGWRPDKGTHNCILLGITAEAADIKLGAKGPDQQSYPGYSVLFRYQMLDPVPGEKEAREWSGTKIYVPADITQIPADKRLRYEIEGDRLTTALTALLGDSFTGDPELDLPAAIALPNASTVVVEVFCNHKPGKPKPGQRVEDAPVFFTDTIQKRNS